MTHHVKDFTLHLANALGSTAWALAEDVDGKNTAVLASGLMNTPVNDAVRRAVVLQVISVLQSHAHVTGGGSADLFIFDSGTRKMLLDFGGEFGPITVLTKSQMKIAEGWERAGWRRCLDLLGNEEFATASHDPSRRIEAATDGSYGRGRGGGGSYGWARDDGHFGFDVVHSGNILVAELAAVASLLSAAENGERLRVHIDSQAAIRALTVAAGDGRDSLGNKVENLVRDIENQRKRLDVEFAWVKAHVGHPLNDAADRLARLARQTQDVDIATRAQIAKNIVADALTSHRSALLTAV
jgi:ribonuclease HI